MPGDDRPILIFDGDCGFCRFWVERWKIRTGDRVRYAPYQEIGEQFAEIRREDFSSAVWFIDRDGTISSGAKAIFHAMGTVPGSGWLAWMHRRIPGFAAICEAAYRFVARRRSWFSVWTRRLMGPLPVPSTYLFGRWLFLRLLGIIFLVAFISLWTQVLGLVGDGGILPAGSAFESVQERIGPRAYYLLPTFFWLLPTDGMLLFLCGGGIILSLLLVLGIAPVPMLILLWSFYLSVTIPGQVFFRFQWDLLLLETGFLAIFLAPARWFSRLAREPRPSPTSIWLLRWLLFRLMFQSGMVKLRSGDTTWRDFTALQFHYETQPLPTWIGWIAHQFPDWFQTASVAGMFLTELVVPFFIFAPRRIRHWACAALVGLQMMILTTGNYGYFNLLALALCLLLVDDQFWLRILPARFREGIRGVGIRVPRDQVSRLAVALVLVLVLLVTGTQTLLLFKRDLDVPGPIREVFRWTGPFRTLNRYGLFAVMTTSRPEIQVEGSLDGQNWRPYVFKWKPGDPERRPRFVAPHMPRLDWQMWFAALGSYRNHPWFLAFMSRLLEGSPEVLGLLKDNPFPESPPKYLRGVVYDYRFSDTSLWWREGAWWRRERKSLYAPILSRDQD